MKMKLLLTASYLGLIIAKFIGYTSLAIVAFIFFIAGYSLFMMIKRKKQGYHWYNDLPNTLRLVLVLLAGFYFSLTITYLLLSLILYSLGIVLNDEFQRKVFRMIFPRRSGLVIAFLGLDGAGKTTHISKLKEELIHLGFDVDVVYYQKYLFVDKIARFLRRTRKQSIEGYIEQRFVHRVTLKSVIRVFLSAIDNILMYFFVVMPKVLKGKIVLCDRFIWSTYLRYMIMGYPVKYFKWLYLSIKPHLVIYLDIPAEVSVNKIKERLREGKVHIKYSLLQLKMEEKMYKNLIKHVPSIIINTQKPFHEAHRELLEKVIYILSKVSRKN